MKLCRGPVCGKRSTRNWATLCLALAVTFILYHDPYIILWWHELPFQRSKTAEVTLDMAADSIDDMYHGCQSEAADTIEQFGIFEWHINPNFSIAWALSEERAAKPVDKDLREEHATVLYLHTNVQFKQIQQDFSQAAKWGRSKYSTVGFQYHYLYFHLTEATQILRQNQNSCRTTYLRTRARLSQNVVNQEMRFGIFTLTASSKYSFVFSGNVSCFEIYTCFGAEITRYSSIKQDGQVLIPPYEVFRITDVLTKSQWCNVVYKLQSTKTPRSDLNCELDQNKLKTYTGPRCRRPA